MAGSNSASDVVNDVSAEKQKNMTQIKGEIRDDADDTSSSGTSSDEEDSEDEDEEGAAGSNMPKPPVMRRNINNDLKSRLSAFLPQMEKANKELEDAGDALNHRIDDVGEDEDRYIEMNLGLGVLSEEQDGNDIRFGSSSQSESDGDEPAEPVEALKNLTKKGKKAQSKTKIEEI